MNDARISEVGIVYTTEDAGKEGVATVYILYDAHAYEMERK